MLDLAAARELLDFSSRIGEGQRANEQLEGAVAIHNILEHEGVAYLADEVGMGKTYVALGALALFRHFNPRFRALVIAPRENIQRKWMKELTNFIRHNVRYPDMRVKGINGGPARRQVFCSDLIELVREAALDPDSDFFCRLSSFSLAVSGKGALAPEQIARLRDRLRAQLPWIREEVFDLRSKQAFKDNYARAVCCGLPVFDLVIVDEGHNLKHGFTEHSAARNRVLGLAFGREAASANRALFPHYGLRARRVLFLSATPIEESYRQLWNQLDIFGKAGGFEFLRREDATEDEMKQTAARFLVRRVTTMRAGDIELTKNQYRRMWRRGGVVHWDEPVSVTDPRQKLVVALVQKKVSELLQSERFNASFQIGMLASFESFLETVKLKRLEDDSTFDDPDQTDDVLEREGIDVRTLNRLSSSYRKKFGGEMPHPKMDALVQSLQSSWLTGTKTLVFVRRVASVREIKRKLDERYDDWLIGRLRLELPDSVRKRFEEIVTRYRADRQELLARNLDRVTADREAADRDAGGADSFFAWFFRGEGPRGVLSGANIQQRFIQRGTTVATFFEDNYVAGVLDCAPGEVGAQMCQVLNVSDEHLREELRRRSQRFLPTVKRLSRADRYEAVQAAAIELLAHAAGPHQGRARAIWHERFEGTGPRAHAAEAPPIGEWLELKTFFTELRRRPRLREMLWPEPREADVIQAFREAELRRVMLAAAARLGHAFIDLYVMTIQRLGSLELRAQETADDQSVNPELERIHAFLDLLERQMQTPRSERSWCAYDELADCAAHFGLILDVNLPDSERISLVEAGRTLGQLFGQQQPVGGMAGQVNETLVKQFRMPGYPLVLVSTDLLQEGEDLHTFCSAVHHYGIAWTPSSTEQRIGRVDRVRSQTERRLAEMTGELPGEGKLQVYFPHLEDTVEVLQVRRVLDRMEVFLRLMHEGLVQPNREAPKVDVAREANRPVGQRQVTGIFDATDKLKSAFPVRKELLRGEVRKPAVTTALKKALIDRLLRITRASVPGVNVKWEEGAAEGTLLGTVRLAHRIQPFLIAADQFAGHVRLRCVSPVGRVRPEWIQDEVEQSAWRIGARVGAIPTDQERTYDLTVEEDVLLGENLADDPIRVGLMLRRVAEQADRLEQAHLPGEDQPLGKFRSELQDEVPYGR